MDTVAELLRDLRPIIEREARREAIAVSRRANKRLRMALPRGAVHMSTERATLRGVGGGGEGREREKRSALGEEIRAREKGRPAAPTEGTDCCYWRTNRGRSRRPPGPWARSRRSMLAGLREILSDFKAFFLRKTPRDAEGPQSPTLLQTGLSHPVQQ